MQWQFTDCIIVARLFWCRGFSKRELLTIRKLFSRLVSVSFSAYGHELRHRAAFALSALPSFAIAIARIRRASKLCTVQN